MAGIPQEEYYRYIEDCLSNYPSNLSRLEVLQKDLELLRASTDVQAQNYSAVNNSPKTKHSDPVPEYVQRIEKLENEIAKLDRKTTQITKMIKDLKSPYALEGSKNSDFIKILGLHYFSGNPLFIILETTGWSRATFFRKKRQLFDLALQYLGVMPDDKDIDTKTLEFK
ncbi:MAG: hypothetical protein IJQ57_10640 [Synergistaceae bacterium]|nr:hypothetical protein [Synergistaceae bacterium]